MIRIVGGKYKRRQLKQPDANVTRPTKDVAKEGLFNSLGDISDSTFLDLFSGSGSIGIEAYSRGAKKVYLNDKSDDAIKVIRQNLESLDIKDVYLTRYDYKSALAFYKNKDIKFDYIFLDPPYKMIIDFDFVNEILSHNILNKDGVIIIETDYPLDQRIIDTYVVKTLKYGRSLIYVVRGF